MSMPAGETPDPATVSIRRWRERERDMVQVKDSSLTDKVIVTITVNHFGPERCDAILQLMFDMYLKGFDKEQLSLLKKNLQLCR